VVYVVGRTARQRSTKVSEATYHRWRNSFGGPKAEDVPQWPIRQRQRRRYDQLGSATHQTAPTPPRFRSDIRPPREDLRGDAHVDRGSEYQILSSLLHACDVAGRKGRTANSPRYRRNTSRLGCPDSPSMRLLLERPHSRDSCQCAAAYIWILVISLIRWCAAQGWEGDQRVELTPARQPLCRCGGW
jgi:hypothetical protein